MIDNIYSLVINEERSIKVIFCTVVNVIELPTQRKSKQFKLRWSNKNGSIELTKQVIINFRVGKYKDKVWYYVMPMIVCHMFLCKLGNDARLVQYWDISNKYILVLKEKSIFLNSWQPRKWVRIMRSWVDFEMNWRRRRLRRVKWNYPLNKEINIWLRDKSWLRLFSQAIIGEV